MVLFISVGDARTTTYIACGNVKRIPYDIPGVVRFFIDIIQIAVPVLLVLMGGIDFGKVVISNDDKAMKMATGRFVKRVIGAAGILLVIFLVKLLIHVVGQDSDGMMACISCFTSDENMCTVYEEES